MSVPIITVTGRLTADPEIRFTPTGKAVTSFTVASNDRVKDEASGEWKDGDSCFIRCSVWDKLAENVAESLTRGVEVIVIGKLVQREYVDKDGAKRTAYEVKKVYHIGAAITPSVTVAIRKLERVGASATWSNAGTAATGNQSSFLDEPPF